MILRNLRAAAPICWALLGLLALFGSINPMQAAIAPDSLRLRPLPTISPEQNAQNVPATSTVSVEYDATIDGRTVSTRTFAVHGMQTGLVTQTYRVVGGRIEVAPQHPFKPGEIVHTTATTSTLDLIGQGPMTPTVWTFRVGVTAGAGVFWNSGQALGANPSSAVALGDLDGDGDLDAFVTNDASDNELYFNNGGGNFLQSDHHQVRPEILA